MVDTKSPGDKTLSVPTKTLTLKPRVETGTVRQSFSHGRTKQVVVEKRGKRRIGGDGTATETPTPEPVGPRPRRRAKAPLRPSRAAGRAARRFGRGAAHADRGRRSARASALADAKVRDIEERRLAEEEAKRRNSKEGIEQAEREAAEARRKAEEERHRQEEEAKRKAELEAKKRFGEAEPSSRRGTTTRAAPARTPPARRRPASPPTFPTRTKVRARSVAAPVALCASGDGAKDHRQARAAKAARPPDACHRAECR